MMVFVTNSSSLHTNHRWDCVTAELISLIWGWGPLRGSKIQPKWSRGQKRLLCFWLNWWMDECISHTNVRGTIVWRVLQIYYCSALISLCGGSAALRGMLLFGLRDESCFSKFFGVKNTRVSKSLFWLRI